MLPQEEWYGCRPVLASEVLATVIDQLAEQHIEPYNVSNMSMLANGQLNVARTLYIHRVQIQDCSNLYTGYTLDQLRE